MTQCDQGETGGGCQQTPEDRPPPLSDVLAEEEKRQKETQSAEERLNEPVRDETYNPLCHSDASEPDTSATGTEDNEQPGRQLVYPEIPDFLLPDPPEGSSGKCQIILEEAFYQ